MGLLRVALIQMSSGRDMQANLAHIAEQVALAKQSGAQFILTPENTTMMEPVRAQAIEKAALESDHPALPVFADLATRHGVWLLAGSLSIRKPDGKLVNRSFLFDDQGRRVASYSKIHLFDVDLPGGETYRESRIFEAGESATLADSPWGAIGMTVCYDVRFASLYRHLAQAGAAFLTVPSAFTVPTGQAHWHVLLRARAIETGCFVLAPAQTGLHPEGRQTYGHSLIVSPWGEVLADGGSEPGLVVADLDLAAVAQARERVPSLTHDRPFAAAR